MKKKNLEVLYYLAWTIGFIAVIALLYGIIKTLI